jgi:hypothetical protein
MPFQEAGDHLSYELAAQCRHDTNFESSALLPSGRLNSSRKLIYARKYPVNFFIEAHSAICQNKSAASSIKQVKTCISLKIDQEFAHSWLRNSEQLCRSAYRANFDNCSECFDLSKAWRTHGITPKNTYLKISLLTY